MISQLKPVAEVRNARQLSKHWIRPKIASGGNYIRESFGKTRAEKRQAERNTTADTSAVYRKQIDILTGKVDFGKARVAVTAIIRLLQACQHGSWSDRTIQCTCVDAAMLERLRAIRFLSGVSWIMSTRWRTNPVSVARVAIREGRVWVGRTVASTFKAQYSSFGH